MDRSINAKIAHQIRLMRIDRQQTQAEFAFCAGIHTNQVQQLEYAKGNPTIKTLRRIADATDTRLVVQFTPKNPAE